MSDALLPCLLVYPDKETSDYLASLIEAYQFPLDLRPVHSLEMLYENLSQIEDRFIALCEQFWDGADASDILMSASLSYTSGGFAIVSGGPVAGFLPRDYPLPYVQGLDQTEQIATVIDDLSEDLRGQMLGPYQIQNYAGQSSLGRVYEALQPAIKRWVYLTVPYPSASAETQQQFKARAAAMARNSFPAIYSIYEETEISGRRIHSSEPISGPSLFQFYLEGATFDARLLAKILHTSASALKHLHDQQIPHPRIKAKHITISENGVIKLHNIALPSGEAIPDPTEEVALLAQIARSFVNTDSEPEPQIDELLTRMENGEVDLAGVIQTANKIDVDLAPVKLVPEREQAKKAAQEVQKARKSYWLGLMIGGGALGAFLLFILIYTINTYLLVRPGSNFTRQMPIPAGEVQIPNSSETVPVKDFYMDEFEVTIGQYEKFLLETAGQDMDTLLPPGLDFKKENFIPKDWKNMIHAVKRKKRYLGQHITRDTPIFNIDFADAFAYAKWAGKRLPTELEWMRAAAGDQHLKLPWGNKPDPSRANTGADRDRTADDKRPGSLDGFRGLAEVDAHRKTDVSPFEVKNMAGNVTEWVEISPELGEPLGGDGAQKGGNFGYPVLISNQKRLNYPKDTREPWLGLRLVSDTPVEGPKL